MSEEYREFIVGFSNKVSGVSFIYRMCPFCWDLIEDQKGMPPSGYPVHITLSIDKHKKNEFWKKLSKEKDKNQDEINRL